jgi:orotate phosphoribosyltransferase-like protein
MSNMKNILASIEELYHMDYSDRAIADELDIPIEFVEEAVTYLQQRAYYRDQAELEHQLVHSVV